MSRKEIKGKARSITQLLAFSCQSISVLSVWTDFDPVAIRVKTLSSIFHAQIKPDFPACGYLYTIKNRTPEPTASIKIESAINRLPPFRKRRSNCFWSLLWLHRSYFPQFCEIEFDSFDSFFQLVLLHEPV